MFGLFKKDTTKIDILTSRVKELEKEVLEEIKEKNKFFDEKNVLERELKLANCSAINLKANLKLAESFRADIIKVTSEHQFTNLITDGTIKVENPIETNNSNKDLVKAFEDSLNSSNNNCRGACTVRRSNSDLAFNKHFNSRGDAEDLLKQFKSGSLVLVS